MDAEREITPDPQPLRYKLVIEYEGTRYNGWQVQANAPSIQGRMEAALLRLFGANIRIIGAGRTDTGVHARGQVAHFDAFEKYSEAELQKALNAILPSDVAVLSLEKAPPDFHARFSASSRRYIYTIAHRKRALDVSTRWILYSALDCDAAAEASELIAGTRDFAGFSKHLPENGHSYCHVFHASWRRCGDISTFEIKANRFLHGMVRSLVGTLVQIGRGLRSINEFRDALENLSRGFQPQLAPPCGLVLEEVLYDPEEYAFVRNALQHVRQAMNEASE